MPDYISLFFARGYALGKENCLRYRRKNNDARYQIARLNFTLKYAENSEDEDDFIVGFIRGIEEGLEDKLNAK